MRRNTGVVKTAAFAEHWHFGAGAVIIGGAFVNLVNFTISYLVKKNDHSENASDTVCFCRGLA